jgi:flagellar hook assembly protein FlgD
VTNEPVFSPDNDGFQDVLLFNYNLETPNMLATVTIYDDQGRVVRELFKSELMAVAGTFSWDGINDQNFKSSLGIYLAVLEAFDTKGTQKFVKRIAFTLAGKVN